MSSKEFRISTWQFRPKNQFRDRFRFLFPVLTIFPLDEFQRVLGINQCQNQIPDYPRLSHSHPFGYFG